MNLASGNLVINGPHCKVSDFEPTSIKDLNLMRTKKLMPCHKRGSQQRLLTSIVSTTHVEDPLFIKIYANYFGDYGVSNASCCYRSTERIRNSDVLIKINGTCREFENNHELDKKHSTILVECSSGDKSNVIYSNVHAIITQKQEFEDRQDDSEIDKAKAYKVLLVGFDSMSRMNLQRGMPNTYKLLEGKKEWIEMKGFTRVCIYRSVSKVNIT